MILLHDGALINPFNVCVLIIIAFNHRIKKEQFFKMQVNKETDLYVIALKSFIRFYR